MTKVCRVPNITAEAIREQAGPNLRRRAKGRECHLEQLYRHRCCPRGDPRCKKLPEFVGVSRSGPLQLRPTNSPQTVRAKCVRWNWKIGSKHHIPSPAKGHRVASNSGVGGVDTGQVVAAAATKLLESFHDDARGSRKQAAVYWCPMPC